jgi:hypothetical protein
MRGNAAARPLLWDKVYAGIPDSPVTAVTVPDNRFALEGHDADRQIAETRQYLDDAEELLQSAGTADGFFNAKVERYPTYLGRTVLWAGTRGIYGVREHPDVDVRQIMVSSWL